MKITPKMIYLSLLIMCGFASLTALFYALIAEIDLQLDSSLVFVLCLCFVGLPTVIADLIKEIRGIDK